VATSWDSRTLPEASRRSFLQWTVQCVCTPVAVSTGDDPAFPTAGTNGNNTVRTAAPVREHHPVGDGVALSRRL